MDPAGSQRTVAMTDALMLYRSNEDTSSSSAFLLWSAMLFYFPPMQLPLHVRTAVAADIVNFKLTGLPALGPDLSQREYSSLTITDLRFHRVGYSTGRDAISPTCIAEFSNYAELYTLITTMASPPDLLEILNRNQCELLNSSLHDERDDGALSFGMLQVQQSPCPIW